MSTTLDPSNKSSLIALSGGNLVAAGSGMTGSGNNKSVYSVDFLLNDTGYFEGTFTATDASHQEMGFGIGNPSIGVNDWVGDAATSCGELNFENIFFNGSNVGKSGNTGFAAGDTLDCAYNLTASKIWFRRNNGNWNNASTATQNPVGNVGGIAITSIGTNANLKVMVTLGANADTLTMRFSSGSWTHTAPSGYTEVNPSTGSVGTVNGTSTVTATGQSAATSSGTIAATSTVNATGRSTAASSGTIAGTSTVNATGRALLLSVGSIAGTSTVNGVAVTGGSSVGTVNGTSTVTATSTATKTSSGTIAGTSTVTGLSPVAGSAGTIAGTSTVNATGRSTAASVGTINGRATVSGIAASVLVTKKFRFQMPPIQQANQDPRMQKWLETISHIARGRCHNTGFITFTANATTTTVNSDFVSDIDHITLSPRTASAAAAYQTAWFVTPFNGGFTVTHPSSANIDQLFSWQSWGG